MSASTELAERLMAHVDPWTDEGNLDLQAWESFAGVALAWVLEQLPASPHARSGEYREGWDDCLAAIRGDLRRGMPR